MLSKKHLDKYCLKNPKCRYLDERYRGKVGKKYKERKTWCFCLKNDNHAKMIIDGVIEEANRCGFSLENLPIGDNCEGK